MRLRRLSEEERAARARDRARKRVKKALQQYGGFQPSEGEDLYDARSGPSTGEENYQAMLALMIDFQLVEPDMPPWEEFVRRAERAKADAIDPDH